ncbi:BTAD domain-containing putative transcriptional regulator [Sphaerimonospora cavernae]|uniref:BTAD domain-containing putative transcriptional regulator n=1 Tax=Sphaerimonospora cavernae TaxID=1740611 RepID=A0ABV6U112_9ACTN
MRAGARQTTTGDTATRSGSNGGGVSGLDFRVLGSLEVVDARGNILDVGSRKQRAVLALLVLNAPHIVPLDQLIDRLWADEPPSSATGTLQAYISHLRKVLEPRRSPRAPARVLRTREPGYLLDITPDQVDANRFIRAAETARAALAEGRPEDVERILDPALAAWRGTPLADFPDEPFARPTVSRLTDLRASALAVRAEAWLTLGRHAEATLEVERLLEQDPYREGLWALLMRALYRDRRQAEALAAYQRCRSLLGQELGIDPSPELRRLEQAILRQDDSLAGRWPAAGPGITGAVLPVNVLPVNAEGPGNASTSGSADAIAEPVRPPCAGLPRLVGREPHLRRIRERLDDLARGAGGVFLVSGESGIGKTRLAEAAATMAAERGVAVAWSRCSEGSGAPAFWPWVQALQALPDELPEIAGHLSGGHSGHPDEQGHSGDQSDPDTARFLLYDAVARALGRRAAVSPVLIVMDDLHWADAASLRLLAFIGADLHRVPLLVLVTVRPEAAVRPGPAATDGQALTETLAETRPEGCAEALAEALGDLTRQRGTERMSIAPLSPGEIADYLTDHRIAHQGDPAGGLCGSAAAWDAELARALHDRTGGNPFFLGELLRLLSSVHTLGPVTAADVASLAVPDGVRDVIKQRVSRLPEDSQTVLRAAAVIGRDVDADLLETATGISGARLMMLLEPAVATGLLTEVDGGWDYRFSHALVQEALYLGLNRRQRAQLHGRVGTAVEALARGDLVSRLPVLAHHFGLAARVGYAGKATSYATQAARQAAARLAYDEAVGYWERALDASAAERMSGHASERCALLIELGRARRLTGDVDGARAALDEAVTLAAALGDDDAVIEAAAVFGGVALWQWRPYGVVDERMVGVLEDQLHRLDLREDVRRAELLGTLGVELYYGERRPEGRLYALEAVELARNTGDPRLLARTLNNLVMAAWTPEHEEERYRAAEEILTIPGLPRATEVIARMHRMPGLLKSGRLTEYDDELARCLRLTREVRMPEIETQVTFAAAGRAMLDGDWTEAERLAALAAGSHRRTSLWGPDALRLIAEFFCDRGRGRHGELLPELVEVAADESHLLVRPTAVLAAVDAGEEALAHRLMDCWGVHFKRDWTWQFVTWQWGLVAARLGRPDPHGLLAELRPIAGQLVTLGTGGVAWGALHDIVAMLLHRVGDGAGALEHAAAGRDLHRRLGLRHFEGRSAALLRALAEAA